MRIWSIHPKYLDAKGLVAVWREALLAKHVLEGKTKGYTNHPQLNRFKIAKNPVDAINQYLSDIFIEASNRNYNFNKQKIDWKFKKNKLTVTIGQLNYEARHLLNKLQIRDIIKFEQLKTNTTFDSHPLFKVIDGDVENWEIITNTNKDAGL
ncbi:MAG: pyrimidine dimer DNA glycosylase/endonuclease V [Bacteroidota bacterium]|nr:pyrimidine dimer DNA glycosylase/endonuclease V [Bacteroidota bacterium]